MADYSNLTTEQLIERLKKLEKEKCGLLIHEQPEDVENEVYQKGRLPIVKHLRSKDVACGGLDHLLIEGDNLHTLMALQATHRGLVNIIYIDPPYNTGNKDFKYNDSFVDKEDGWRHNKWLSFMKRRLSLARELMRDDGVIFISIDDNEQAALKLLCDDVFGEENFISNFIWHKKSGGGNDNLNVVAEHEYVLCYAKVCSTNSINSLDLSDEDIKAYKTDANGLKYREESLLMRGPNASVEKRPNLCYDIKCPDGSVVWPRNKLGTWRYQRSTFDTELAAGNIIFRQVGNEWRIYTKQWLVLSNGESRRKKPRTILNKNYDIGQTGNGTAEVAEIFGSRAFDNPKPLSLIKFLLKLKDKNSIVLDFFAGSGTTGQAVLELNKEDGGKRQVILATNNENNICEEITLERCKRVMKGYTNSKGIKVSGLGDNLRYFKTSFVANSSSDKQLRLNMNAEDAYGHLICIEEGVFSLKKETACYKIYSNDTETKAVAFVKDDRNLTGLVEFLSQAKGRKKVYKFELEEAKDPDFEALFEDVSGVSFAGIDKFIKSYINLMRR